MNELKPRVAELLAMLRYKRPGGSATERAFVERYITPLPRVTTDAYGNHWCRIGKSQPTIMWSSHTDTVHRTEGLQKIEFGDSLATAVDNGNECLGADCTVGVWLMRRMILAGVPGLYLFHADEEVGGKGSDWIAKHKYPELASIKFAIALDRRGYDDVITHQAGERCASDAFANSLASALRLANMKPSRNGTFTDTANYTRLIPECTNLSVGYFSQHTKNEYQDITFADGLLDRLLRADWSTLVCERDHTAAVEYDTTYSPWWERYGMDYDDYKPGVRCYTHPRQDYPPHTSPYASPSNATPNNVTSLVKHALAKGSTKSLSHYVRTYPGNIVDFFEMMNISVAEIEEHLFGGTSDPFDPADPDNTDNTPELPEPQDEH